MLSTLLAGRSAFSSAGLAALAGRTQRGLGGVANEDVDCAHSLALGANEWGDDTY